MPHTSLGRRTAVALDLLAALLLAACAAPPLVLERPVVLLGEVHDNAAQHAIRLRAFAALLARGARPALLMEQLDREQQPHIDALRASASDVDADRLIAAAGGKGWDWAHYRPFIALALRHGLPIVAANVSRADARRVIQDGLAAHGFDAAVPADILTGQARLIEASHCGQVDAATAQRLARAQVARDQYMARQVEAHAARGVVLLAGNGHVRTDLGVPRWLSAPTRARSESIGLLERGDPAPQAYDRIVVTPAQARPDPCAEVYPGRKPGVAAHASPHHAPALPPRTDMNATARQIASSSAADITLQPMLDLFNTWTQNMFALQRVQLEAIGSWQASIAAIHQELWDEWVSRWAGGVPLDG